MKRHTFAICAYRDSPYLEACIRSLKAQSHPTDIILCTSTPSSYIEEMADRYGIPVYVRQGKSQIRDDWEFAWHMADAELVTIAHQDDIYRRDYVKTLLNCCDQYPDMTVFATGYSVVKGQEPVRFEKVEFIKRFLRIPLRIQCLSDRTLVKKSIFLFGNSICCPSCTYHKKLLGEPLFTSPYRFVLDWDTLLNLAERPGRFICVEQPLLYYRVHDGAETKACMADDTRPREEMLMFSRTWPGWAVKLLMHFYRKAYDEYGGKNL